MYQNQQNQNVNQQAQSVASEIDNYVNAKARCESELARSKTNLAIAENQLANVLDQASKMFGTVDIAKLNTMVDDLLIEKRQLEEEINKLNIQG